jgi:hypothetical protein
MSSSPIPLAPCTWPIDRSVLPALPATNDPKYAAAFATQLACEDIAVSVLWALSGRQFGICETFMRPCADEHQPLEGVWGPVGTGWISQVVAFDGDWIGGWFGGRSAHRCVISSPQAVHLPGPVYLDDTGDYDVTVYIGDKVLDDDEYEIEGDVLHRRHGDWPRQMFAKPMGEHGTWGVAYWRGTPPPAGAARFVGCLASEFIAACTGGKCRLPATVTRVSRAGASYEVDPSAIYAAGKVGVPEIDMFLASINPHHLQQAPSVI